MKKILIVGEGSYIGTSFRNWLKEWPEKYSVDTVGTMHDEWQSCTFAGYDAVFHVAGIAHVSADPKLEDTYYRVNRDLAIETAEKAKAAGVKQFIFMSSIIVYGDSGRINQKRIIDCNTIPTPTNFYGDSKFQAEEGIQKLQGDAFNVVILRPPMIYGKGSKGNYPRLARLAQKLPIFPDIDNQRSMLYIDNLCEFIRLMIENKEHGTFFPQNAEYVNTSEMVRLIAEAHQKKIRLTKFLNPLIRLLGSRIGAVNKVFGNLVYEKSMSQYKENYRARGFEKSIRLTEM